MLTIGQLMLITAIGLPYIVWSIKSIIYIYQNTHRRDTWYNDCKDAAGIWLLLTTIVGGIIFLGTVVLFWQTPLI